MRNIDRLREMTSEEIARFLIENSCCSMCVNMYADCTHIACMSKGCEEGVKEWLEREI